MWILVTRNVPVSPECKPEWLGIYWALPWIDAKAIKEAFWRFRVGESTDLARWSEGRKKDIPLEVFQNIHDESRYPEDFKSLLKRFASCDFFLGANSGGVEPNPSSTMRVIINQEAIKLWPHEYKRVSNDDLQKYIREKLYTLKSCTVVEEQIEKHILEGVALSMYEQCIVEGCSDHEARLMVTGVDVSERYDIPPTGWYKYIGEPLDESWQDVGMPISGRNRRKRSLAHA